MIDFFERLLYGNTEYLKHSDLAKLTRRHPFSAFLNYVAYDQKNEIYVNQDSTFGMIWECSPLTYAGEKAMNSLEGIFRAGMPYGTIIQFVLHADSHIEPIIERYRNSRTRTEPIIATNTERVTEFLIDGKKGLEACSFIPVRNFRLFVAVKVPGDATGMPKPEELDDKKKVAPILDIKRQINETLRAAHLYPRNLSPGDLIEWMRRLLNAYPKDYPEHNFNHYSPDIPILKQIINADTVIKEGSDYIQAGDKYWCCTTPKSFPREVDPMQTNSLFGGIWGIVSDADQIKTDFLYSFNIVNQKGLDVTIHAKTNLMLNQKGVGSLSTLLHRKQAEHIEAADDLEHGVKFLKIIPVFWVVSDDVEKARDSCTRVRRLWENNGYVMQRDNMVLKILFISSFPLCLYANGKNMENLERDFTAPVPSITPLLPVQGDFVGSGGTPNLIFTGRKGQLVSLDFFAKGATNFNCFCCATSGSGKSFLVNFIAFNYFACGSIIRIIDIGGSYKKIADMLGARYLDFSPDSDICLNPFTNIIEPEEELAAISTVFVQMAYANSSKGCEDVEELNLFYWAVDWAWKQKGQAADANTVVEFFKSFPNGPGMEAHKGSDTNKNLMEKASKLGFLLMKFSSHGYYGRFFCGPSTFDIKNDEFVVLELENLKVKPDLYKVVTMLIINAVTQDLYLSDRSRHRLIIFDEAWQFLDKSSMLAPVVNEGYRRARKYSGSFMIITQSILDLDLFGEVGTVIKDNSAFKIFLESPAFDKAKDLKLIDYDDFSMKLLKSIKSNPPHYSEIFFDTPFGIGPARLIVNDYAYFIYTSKASEIAMIEERVKSGMTYLTRPFWKWLSCGKMVNCKFFLIFGLVFGLLLLANYANAKNLGSIGTTYPVAEPDLVEEVKARIDKGKMAKIMEGHRQNYKPKDIHALPTAKRDRTFFVDMTYTLDHDIPGENGEIMYERGLTWNPLDYVSPPELVVINGESAKQVEWFEKSPYYKNLKIKLLISAGFAAPLIKQLDRPVFYLTKTIADRLQLTAAPCVITQNGKKMMVQEVKFDE